MNAQRIVRAGLLLLCGVLASGQPFSSAAAGDDDIPVLRHDFGRIVQGAVVTHEFRITNDGPRPFRMERIETSAPVKLRMVPAEIPPGGAATAKVSVHTNALKTLDARLRLFGQAPDNLRAHAVIELKGEIYAPVSVEPGPGISLAGTRADRVVRAVELVNHEAEPLEVRALEYAAERFTARVETVDAGKRLRIVVSLKPDGPAGRGTGPLLVRTNSRLRPEIGLSVSTLLRERVYTFPESVDFGTVRLSDLKKNPQLARAVTQTLMVYGKGSSDFDVRVASDLPFLAIRSVAGPQGDRFQQDVALIPDELKPGPIRGSISVRTNDKEFPFLSVPVTGNILDR